MTALAEKTPISLRLSQLAIDARNMRAEEAPDDEIDELAQSLLAGQLLPLFVSPEREGYYGVLDGRRRLLAYAQLRDNGEIDEDFEIRCILCETPEEIAQATIVANTDRAEVTHADFLLSVHRMQSQFKSVDQMARLLGVEPKRVRQFARLGALDKALIDAYRDNRVALPDLRHITAIKDPERIEALVKKAKSGGSIWSYECYPDDSDEVRADSPYAQIAGIDAYLAAGGTIEQDIFEDRPDTIQDVALLRRLWIEAVRPVAQAFQDQGVKVIFQPDYAAPDETLAELPYNFKGGADQEAQNAAIEALAEASGDTKDLDRDAFLRVMADTAALRLKTFMLYTDPLTVKAIYIYRGEHGSRLRFRFYVDADELAAYQKADADHEAAQNPAPEPDTAPTTPPVEVDTGGYSHDLHKTTTALSGDGLAASLAGMPSVAFDALLSRLFQDAAVDRSPQGNDALIGIDGMIRYGGLGFRTGAPLREELTQTLKDWADDWRATGLPVFTWISAMRGEEKGNLLAHIVALNLSLAEARTDALRPKARAEAGLIAEALKHDIRDHWTPDEAFWRMHTKKQLLAFAETIEGADLKALSKLKADALYPAFAELAAKADFVPPALILTGGAETDASDDETLTGQGDNPGAETEQSEAAE